MKRISRISKMMQKRYRARLLYETADFLDEAANMECEDEAPIRALVDKFRNRAEELRDMGDELDRTACKVDKRKLKVETP